MKTGKLLSLLIAILALAGLSAWLLRQPEEKVDAGTVTTTVTRRDFSSTVFATGEVRLQVGAEVRVGSRLSGKVDRLLANIGDMVEKGQEIARLEKEDLEAIVAQQAAELAMAEAQLSAIQSNRPLEIQKAEADIRKWEATVVLAEAELKRQEDLLKGEIVSRQAQEQARERVDVAKAELESARQELQLAKSRFAEDVKLYRAEVERERAALEYARVQLSYATIRAPISGVIGSVSTQEGETVAAGLNAPTFVTIIDPDRLQVDAYVDEVDIGRVQPGQKVLFTVDSFPDKEFEGETVTVYPRAVLQDNVVNYDVVVEITSPHKDLLRPEMTASVTIFLEERPDVLSIPARALRRQQGKYVVSLKNGELSETKEVRVGWRDGEWIEVLEGLSEGDVIFID